MPETQFFPNEPTRFTAVNINQLLTFCETLNASDVTIQTGQAIFAEVYGRLRRITHRKLSNTEVGDIVNAIYGPNGTAQLLSGVDIDTHYEFKPSRDQRFRYRVNGVSCMVEGHDAIQITLRSIPTTPPLLSSLALPQEIIDAIAPCEGIVFVTGATGSGKSTLLASIIRTLVEQPDSHRKVLTFEAPIEFVFDEIAMDTAVVSQSEIPRHLPSFAAGIRNALRRKPHVIMVGECRDTETISAALEAALTGHPVYTTLHTSGVAETLRRLVMAFPKDERHGRTVDIIESIRLCIWQRLVPTKDGKRVALREYLVFNEAVRDELLKQDPDKVTSATRHLLKQHGRLMKHDAEEKYAAGIITKRTYQVTVEATD